MVAYPCDITSMYLGCGSNDPYFIICPSCLFTSEYLFLAVFINMPEKAYACVLLVYLQVCVTHFTVPFNSTAAADEADTRGTPLLLESILKIR